jgi:periplasmic divalent cation tolerance protein
MHAEARHVIAYTAFTDRDQAIALAHSAVERQLAASVRIHQTTSVRPLDGRVVEGTEFLLEMQTATPMLHALKAHVLSHHPADVPEFVVVPIIAANENYLGWVDDYVDERRTLQESVAEPSALERHEIDPRGHVSN